MARLGKRERQIKRATIKANLARKGPVERSGSMSSYLDTTRLLGRTHTGYREPQNAKGQSVNVNRPARWSDN